MEEEGARNDTKAMGLGRYCGAGVSVVSSMGGSGSRVIRGGGRSFGQPAPWS